MTPCHEARQSIKSINTVNENVKEDRSTAECKIVLITED